MILVYKKRETKIAAITISIHLITSQIAPLLGNGYRNGITENNQLS